MHAHTNGMTHMHIYICVLFLGFCIDPFPQINIRSMTIDSKELTVNTDL